MLKFRENQPPILLEGFGFTQANPMNGGVYHLKNVAIENATSNGYIVLLYSPAPITPETKSVKLFMQRVPDPLPIDVSAQQIQKHWQNLDARRLEESGLEAITLALPANGQWQTLPTKEYIRPGETQHIRYCVQLPTGDVVCYN